MAAGDFTESDLIALNNAIKIGAKKVKYGDKETEYHSLAEMIALRNLMKDEIYPSSSIASRRRVGTIQISAPRHYPGY